LRHKGSPWQPLSAEHGFEISTKRNEYELAIQPVVTAEDASVMIKFEDIPGAEFTLDNFEFYEAKVVVTDPDDVVLFEVNPSKSKKTITLDGIYVDPNNMPYYGEITLEPFSSIILIRISEPIPPVEEVNLPPTVRIVSPVQNAAYDGPQEIEIKVEAEGKNCGIKKVEFFSGDKLLGTANSAPYIYTGKSIQAGKYTITAKATDVNAKVSVSEAVVVTVKKPVASEIDAPKGSFSLYLNTGTTQDVTVDGKVFKGDKNLKYHGFSYENANTAASKDKLYQTERNGSTLNYAIPVPNGTYTVKTYHNELWWGLSGRAGGKGRRVFDISIEGKLLKDDFDIYESSNNKQTVLTFQNIEVKDGKLNLDMVASRDRASISGIEIVGSSAQVSKTMAQARISKVEEMTAVEETAVSNPVTNSLAVKMYPNPAKEVTTVAINQDVSLTTILIHDMSGQIMQQLDPRLLRNDGGRFQIPLNSLSSGIYLVSVVGEKEVYDRLRLIVQ